MLFHRASNIEVDQTRVPPPPLERRDLEVVAYALSHDLRAPLRAIEGYGRALAADLGDSISPAAAHDLSEMLSGIERMFATISKWLSFIRACTSTEVNHELVDLSSIAQSIVGELRAAEPWRTVSVHITPDLRVSGDSVLLRQMLQNLLGNAWKFTAHVDATAMIELGQSPDTKHLFVRDNGIGLDATNDAYLFNPFARQANASTYEGNGIGLAIVRYIVELHGGVIWAEGQPGLGAIFNFKLAIAKSVDASDHAITQHSNA
jgi:signal transduction histidine kinase